MRRRWDSGSLRHRNAFWLTATIGFAGWRWKITGSTPKGEDTVAVGLKQYYEFPCDSVSFLPSATKWMRRSVYPTKAACLSRIPNKTGNDPDDALFQAYDESTGHGDRRRVFGRMGSKSKRRVWSASRSVTEIGVRKSSSAISTTQERQRCQDCARSACICFSESVKVAQSI